MLDQPLFNIPSKPALWGLHLVGFFGARLDGFVSVVVCQYVADVDAIEIHVQLSNFILIRVQSRLAQNGTLRRPLHRLVRVREDDHLLEYPTESRRGFVGFLNHWPGAYRQNVVDLSN